jgi:hypothetical protein
MDSHSAKFSHGLGVIEGSRPGSAQSNRSTTSTSDLVKALLMFEGISTKRSLKLSLTESPLKILADLSLGVAKIRRNARIEHERHEMKIIPLKPGNNEDRQFPLDPAEFEDEWQLAVDFIKANRDPNLAQDFLVHILEPGE